MVSVLIINLLYTKVLFKQRLKPNSPTSIHKGHCKEKTLEPDASLDKKEAMLSVTVIIFSFLKRSERMRQTLFKYELLLTLNQDSANSSCKRPSKLGFVDHTACDTDSPWVVFFFFS